MRDKIFDDLAGMVGGAAGILADIRDQVRGGVQDRLSEAADRMNLASRDDLTALEARVAALEALLTGKTAPGDAGAKPAAPKHAAPKHAANAKAKGRTPSPAPKRKGRA